MPIEAELLDIIGDIIGDPKTPPIKIEFQPRGAWREGRVVTQLCIGARKKDAAILRIVNFGKDDTAELISREARIGILDGTVYTQGGKEPLLVSTGVNAATYNFISPGQEVILGLVTGVSQETTVLEKDKERIDPQKNYILRIRGISLPT